MTIRRTLGLALFLTTALIAAACSGSSIGLSNEEANSTYSGESLEDDAQGESLSDIEAESDAGPPVADDFPSLPCLIDNCAVEECRNTPSCVTGLLCAAACQSAECAQSCVSDVSTDDDRAALEEIVACGEISECFQAVEPEPEPTPECGDLVCGEDEDATSCPEDCTGQGAECLIAACELGNCMDIADCAGAVSCMGECIDSGCVDACISAAPPEAAATLEGFATCGEEAGCFEAAGGPAGPTEPVCGDDECDDSEDETSCPEDCEGSITPGDDPVCGDGECEAPEDATSCAEDCQNIPGPGDDPVCGDGQCEAPEDASSCAEDCGAPPTESCVEDNCDLGLCMDFDICAEVVACMNACDDSACAAGCLDGAPGSVLGLLGEALTCGEAAGCFESAPEPPPEDTCLKDSCDTGNCEQFEECQAALDCMSACTTQACAEGCVAATPPAFQAPLYNLVDCGAEAGCYGAVADAPCCSPHPGAGCSDDTCEALVCDEEDACCDDTWSWDCAEIAADICPACGEASVCGDGECAPNENPNNCPEDCNAPTNGFLSCMYGVCEEELEDCFADPVCADAFPCLEDCVNNGGQGCTGACMPDPENDTFYTLGLCGGQNGCGNICGDGACGPGETNESCPEDCQVVTPPPVGDCETVGTTDDGGEFIVCTDKKPWSAAKEACDDMGAVIASVRSEAENDTLFEAINESVWLGFNDLEDEGTFVWADDSPVNFTAWNQNEPNDYNGNEDCTQLLSQNDWAPGLWNDAVCGNALAFACRIGGDGPGPGPGPGPDPGPGDGCVQDNCEVGWQCNWGGCEEAIACVSACDSPECADGCVEGADWWQQNAIADLATCAEAAGCF